MLKRKLTWTIALALVLGFAAAQDDGSSEDATADASAIEALEADGRFTTFVESLNESGLVELVESEEVTLLAPIDDAVEADAAQVAEVASLHVLDGAYTSDELAEMDSVPTVEGSELEVSTNDAGRVTVEGVAVLAADSTIGDDVVHLTDGVVSP